MLFLQLTSRIAKGVRFYLTWRLNKLACHHFMDAGRRCETPGSESKDFFTPGTASIINISVFLSGLLALKSHGKTTDGPRGMPAQAAVVLQV